MDTSNPAPIVNGELLRRYQGRRVRCVLKMQRPDGGGSGFVGQSSDGQQVTVRQAPHSVSFSPFVEVIGVVEPDRCSLRAEICTNFGDNFDMSSYNQLCQMANGEHQSLFV